MDKNHSQGGRRRLTLAGVEAVGLESSRSSTDLLKIMGLLNTKDPLLREGAIKALAKIRGRDATSAIVRCLNDPATRVRVTACKALGSMRAHDAKAGLYDSLTDEDPIVCCSAAEALFLMGDQTGMPRVKKFVCTPGDHQWRALRSLNMLTEKDFHMNGKGLKNAIKWIKSNKKRLFRF